MACVFDKFKCVRYNLFKRTYGVCMSLNITKLRANLYNIIDQVIETGIAVEVERNGKVIKIMSVEKRSKLANLKPHPGTIIGDPEALVHMDWSHSWKYHDDFS